MWVAGPKGTTPAGLAQHSRPLGAGAASVGVRQARRGPDRDLDHVTGHPIQLGAAQRICLCLHDSDRVGELTLHPFEPPTAGLGRPWRRRIETFGVPLHGGGQGVAPSPADLGHAGRRPRQTAAHPSRDSTPALGALSSTPDDACTPAG